MKYLNKIALLLAVVCSALLSGCTSEPEAERALSGAGYNNITMTGYRFSYAMRGIAGALALRRPAQVGSALLGLFVRG
jgi:hypothetical protein